MPTPKRAFVYIDGFNLYFSLKKNGWKKYYWLDVEKLAADLLFPGHSLQKVKYFTAPIKRPADKVLRQQAYLRALGALKRVDIFFGRYQYNEMECYACHRMIPVHKEKKTDVNIAVQMILDAVSGRCDVQYLMSGDSDLTPPVREIKELFPGREILLLFPPKPVRMHLDSPDQGKSASRISRELIEICRNHRHIKEEHLRQCILPGRIENLPGTPILCPREWQ